MRKRKSYNGIIKLTIYPFDVMLSVNQTDKQFVKSLGKYKMPNFEDDILHLESLGDNRQGRTILLDKSVFIVRLNYWPENEKGIALLVHELFHVTSMLLDHIGMELSIGTSCEAYAYLLQYLTQYVLENLYILDQPITTGNPPQPT